MAIERTMEGGPRAYRPTDGFFDEVFAPDGAPRPHAAGLVSALERLGPEQLAAAGRNRDKIFLQQGITFELTGEDGPVDRPWPLDLVPRILPASERTHIKRGLAQRIRALNQFHLGLILLRRNGIAARYVSGYLWAAPEEGGDDSVEVETHAWIEALLPGGARGEPIWRGADPTNRRLAGETHVKIGHGRTYADVPPIKGVFRGSATSELEARVTMTRVDREASAGV